MPFGVRRGPIDSRVMSLVLAGVRRDRSGMEGEQKGGWGVREEPGSDSQQQTNPIAADIRTNTRVHLLKPG